MKKKKMRNAGLWSGGAAMCGLAAVLSLSGGCGYRPGSKGFKGAAHTYTSTTHRPATLSLIDTRTGEVVWTVDVPPGKQVVTKFVEGAGTDPVERPDRLDYAVMDLGDKHGRLRSVVSVPDAASRRWDLTYREGPEYEAAGKSEYREYEQVKEPFWWTEEDGEYRGEAGEGQDGN